jgi:hypothetical protein
VPLGEDLVGGLAQGLTNSAISQWLPQFPGYQTLQHGLESTSYSIGANLASGNKWNEGYNTGGFYGLDASAFLPVVSDMGHAYSRISHTGAYGEDIEVIPQFAAEKGELIVASANVDVGAVSAAAVNAALANMQNIETESANNIVQGLERGRGKSRVNFTAKLGGDFKTDMLSNIIARAGYPTLSNFISQSSAVPKARLLFQGERPYFYNAFYRRMKY